MVIRVQDLGIGSELDKQSVNDDLLLIDDTHYQAVYSMKNMSIFEDEKDSMRSSGIQRLSAMLY